MFIDSTNYKSHVEALIDQSTKLKIAVAYWGRGAEKLLQSESKGFKVICNLMSGGTNPEVIRNLRKFRPRVEVRHHDDLHAKVFIGDHAAIIGSANMSTNGLNIESEEFDGWQEAGYHTDHSGDIGMAEKWFSKRWKEAQAVTPAMLRIADKAWEKRRDNRVGSSSNFADITPVQAKDLKIFVAFHKEDASPAAKKIAEELERSEPEVFGGLTYFTSCELMKEHQELISVQIQDKSLVVDGAYKRKFKSFNRGGESFQYAKKISFVKDRFRFNGNDKKIFQKRLLVLFPTVIMNLDSWYIPLADVLQILQEKEHELSLK
jgi:phosphatidylserine/phosphatidylglycerophosphate/cardiolipin synthase-like enzyme